MTRFLILRLSTFALGLLLLAGCNSNIDPTTATLAGAAIGAGTGMAVSNEEDKTKGALVGAGVGALAGSMLATEANRSQRPVYQSHRNVPVQPAARPDPHRGLNCHAGC